MSRTRTALYLIPLLLAAAAAGYVVSRLLARPPPAPQLAVGTRLPAARTLPAFRLDDHNGDAFDNARLAGAPSLLFFGFTHCPDVCPTTLAQMAQLRRDPALAALRLVFVTVDPGRDDPATLKQYVDAFGNGITGVRGEEGALAPLLTAMSVAHAIQPLPGGGYTVDHSAALHYVNARGEWSAVFTPPFDAHLLRQDLGILMASGF
jgi:protein SCO1/2